MHTDEERRRRLREVELQLANMEADLEDKVGVHFAAGDKLGPSVGVCAEPQTPSAVCAVPGIKSSLVYDLRSSCVVWWCTLGIVVLCGRHTCCCVSRSAA